MFIALVIVVIAAMLATPLAIVIGTILLPFILIDGIVLLILRHVLKTKNKKEKAQK
jgi:uncharacterized protein YhhL (DUF1145 family)